MEVEVASLPDIEFGSFWVGECCLCFEPHASLLDPPCCSHGGQGSFCVDCLRRHGVASQSLFRCPLCKDDDAFVAWARTRGVEAGAALPFYATQEVAAVTPKCSLATCRCPRGRRYDSTGLMRRRDQADGEDRWALWRCRVCGSSWGHEGCGISLPFACADCAPSRAAPAAPSRAAPEAPAAAPEAPPPEAEAAAPPAAPERKPLYGVGDAVEGLWRGQHKFYPARVINVHSGAPATYDVKYDDDATVERRLEIGRAHV